MSVRATFAILGLLALVALPLIGEDKKAEKTETSKVSRFEKFKQLAGEWVGKGHGEDDKDGHDVAIKYKVSSGGSVVVETIAPDTDHEMVTVIHPDGDDLLLTHYCMLGNQPQMKASAKGDPSKIAFKFVRATNLSSDKAMHMHDVTFTFVDKDTIKTEWTNFDEGKPAGTHTFEMKRKK